MPRRTPVFANRHAGALSHGDSRTHSLCGRRWGGEPGCCETECRATFRRDPTGHRAAVTALGRPAGGVAAESAGRAAARYLPACRAVRPGRRPGVRDQGGAGAPRDARVPAAPRPGTARRAVGRARRRDDRPGRQGRRAARLDPGHQAPAVLAAVPGAVLAHAPPGHREPVDRRAGRADRAAAPDRVLLGRLLAVQHAVPARRRRVRGVPGRRRDRRAARRDLQRPARARPRDRADQHLRRAARPAGGRAAGPDRRPAGDRRVDRQPVRGAVGRADLRGGVPHRRAAPAWTRGSGGSTTSASTSPRSTSSPTGTAARSGSSRRSSTPGTTPGGCSG